MSLLDAMNAFFTCTTLVLSTQSLNRGIPSFFSRSLSVLMSTIRITLSAQTEMHSALSFHSRIPWSCHCPGPPVSRKIQRPTEAHVCCFCVHYSVDWKRTNWAFICLGFRYFPPHLQVSYRRMPCGMRAKDESAVDIKCRRFSCNFLRES
jgi:hypothetical protein